MVADRQFINELKERLPMSSLLGQVHQMGKIRCFVHDDRHPSMTYDEKTCKCWACGYYGDIFDVIAYQNDLDISNNFKQVVSIAADIAGMSLPKQGKKKKVTAHLLTAEERQLLGMGKKVVASNKGSVDVKSVVPSILFPVQSGCKDEIEAGDYQSVNRDNNGEYIGYVASGYSEVALVSENQDLYDSIVQNKCLEKMESCESIKNALLYPSKDNPMTSLLFQIMLKHKVTLNEIVKEINRLERKIEDIYVDFGGRVKRKDMHQALHDAMQSFQEGELRSNVASMPFAEAAV